MGLFEIAIASILSTTVFATSQSEPAFKVWVSDALVKVLPDTKPPASTPDLVSIEAVRNEYESGQVVVTALERINELKVSVDPVSGSQGVKPSVHAHFVGFVPIAKGTPNPPEKVVAKAPAEIPDPILDARSVSVEAGKNQPIWLTVHVPKNCQPGKYESKLHISADGTSSSVPIEILVHPVTLPDERTLKLTNWFNPGKFASVTDIRQWREAQWKIAEAWARLMAEHRQNVVITPIFQLITGREDASGQITWDFSLFDKWVEVFKKAGVIGYIEGGHLGGRSEWEAPDFDAHWPNIYDPDGKLKPNPRVKVTSEEERKLLSSFLPALQKHLEQRGWLDIYLQHLCDEPIPVNAESYKKLASYVREYAPKLKIIDACMCTEIAGYIDIWVPLTDHFDRERTFFETRKKLGEEVWFYTCLSPKGNYMNRFIDYPLIDVRLIHWMNFRYDVTGYLHWGLNYWHGDAFKDLEPDWGGGNYLPPGDSHIVYPGSRGPLTSIRFEALRDGVEDYELLKMLERKDPNTAHQIAESVVRTPTDYTLDPAEFRKARARIITCLME